MRWLYSMVWRLAMPAILLRLFWRGRAEPGYRRHIGERLACFAHDRPDSVKPLIWIHAVSVGETHAAWPLVQRLLQAYPGHAVLMTHMTPTGRATSAMLANGDPRILQCYLPYDTPSMAGRFIEHFRPCLGILMETEVWPNLVRACRLLQIPVALVNARLSERSLRRGERFSGLLGEAARDIDVVVAQTEGDAMRLARLGATHVAVSGNTKFDVDAPLAMIERAATLRQRFPARPVLLCASTRDGEEALILDAWRTVRGALPTPCNALLLLVPRHPQRFAAVRDLIVASGFSCLRRSELESMDMQACADTTDVLLGDTMGEMFCYAAMADLAFIGGSLLPLGGQNLIEACAVGTPVLLGPHTFNFALISEQAVAAGAARRVQDAANMVSTACELLQASGQLDVMSLKALAFARQHRGAAERTLDYLRPLLPTQPEQALPV